MSPPLEGECSSSSVWCSSHVPTPTLKTLAYLHQRDKIILSRDRCRQEPQRVFSKRPTPPYGHNDGVGEFKIEPRLSTPQDGKGDAHIPGKVVQPLSLRSPTRCSMPFPLFSPGMLGF